MPSLLSTGLTISASSNTTPNLASLCWNLVRSREPGGAPGGMSAGEASGKGVSGEEVKRRLGRSVCKVGGSASHLWLNFAALTLQKVQYVFLYSCARRRPSGWQLPLAALRLTCKRRAVE